MDDDKYDEMMSKREEEGDVATEFHEILINSPLEYYFGVQIDSDSDEDDDDDFPKVDDCDD